MMGYRVCVLLDVNLLQTKSLDSIKCKVSPMVIFRKGATVGGLTQAHG